MIMSKKNYKELASQILTCIGGKENVNRVYHCQTRLRFTLADEGKANKDTLEALDGVRKVIISSGVYQVVIGTDVADLFAELELMVGVKSDTEETPTQKQGILNTIVDFVSSIFMPVIPALSGAGMLKALWCRSNRLYSVGLYGSRLCFHRRNGQTLWISLCE